MDLDLVRHLWHEDRPMYERLCQYLEQILKQRLAGRGVKCHIESRVKSVSSLVRKFIRKGYSDYARISDKIGIRVVVSLPSEIPKVETVLFEVLCLVNKQDKLEELEPDQVGYLSVHYDTSVKQSDLTPEQFWDMPVEVQVRSMCQDIWAQMAHAMIYKPTIKLPKEVSRRVYALSALLEICDREFEAVYEHLMASAEAWPRVILENLQEYFYRHTSATFDGELSLQVIEHLKPLIDEFYRVDAFGPWAEERDEILRHVYGKYRSEPDRWVFLFQPESLLLFYLLERDRFALVQHWIDQYPFDQLQGIANAWGTTVEFE